ncbi:hypothetical protein ABZ646_21850 [Streptomyces sp. NPDC007162]|uniref:hypothetical protein n=1 Tax=Streptomyces sp. NPDC007162 TaxID=3156917 RepID=UPI0033F6C7A8
MSDCASLICWDCSLVLDLGWFQQSAVQRRIFTDSGPGESDPLATAAVWKFLGEHVYHRVELAGEMSPPWDRIDQDFTTIDSDVADSPSLLQYVEDDWDGRHLLVRPRPLCTAVRAALAPFEEARQSGRWTAHPAEEAAVEELLPLTRWPLPAGRRVDDAEVLARAATAGRARAALDRVAASFPDHQAGLPAALRAFSGALAPAGDIATDALLKGRGDFMPAALFDAERALGLIGTFLDDIAYDYSHPSRRGDDATPHGR